MTFAAIVYSMSCSPQDTACYGLFSTGDESNSQNKGVINSNISEKVPFGSLGFDALVAISLLVVGLLGATSVIAMSPAAAYSMIGISGAFILADVSPLIIERIENACKKSQPREINE